jgi:hypothetical protein
MSQAKQMNEIPCKNGEGCQSSNCGFGHPGGQKEHKKRCMKNTPCILAEKCENKKCGFKHTEKKPEAKAQTKSAT